MKARSIIAATIIVGSSMLLAACGGGGGGATSNSPAPPVVPPVVIPPTPPPPLVGSDPQYLASTPSPFAANCDGVAALGTLYVNAEVEPFLAIDPRDPHNLIGVWQQDRWSTGGSSGVVSAASADGGLTWKRTAMPFTRCAGGNAGNGGDYARASNAWLTIAADGTAHEIALAFNGSVLGAGSASAVLATRSLDGGLSWSKPIALIADGANFFNDKDAVTADPVDPHKIYAVWDRLTTANTGPSFFTRSTDGGASWEPARSIYDPGTNNQTIANVLVVLPNGTLVNLLTQINGTANGGYTSLLAVIRSIDDGLTWSTPFKIADIQSVGTRDPQTNARVRDSSLVGEITLVSGGNLVVVWQDARFENGAHDDVVMSRSADGGLTWSAPTRVNTGTTAAAFSPFVHARSDGEIGVSYFDFSNDTADAGTLLTSAWLARSMDGISWQRSLVAAPFDLDLAPATTSPAPGGLFLGDYQGLDSAGTLFVSLFAQTNTANAGNRTDIYAEPAVSLSTSTATIAKVATSDAAAMTISMDSFRARVSENISSVLRQRRLGWAEESSSLDRQN